MGQLHQLNLGWGSFALNKGRLGAGLSKKPLQRVIEFMERYEYAPTRQEAPLAVCYPSGHTVEICSTQTKDVQTFIVLWTNCGGLIGMTMNEKTPAGRYEASNEFAIVAMHIHQLKPLNQTPSYSGFIESIKIDGHEMLAQPIATCIFQNFWGWTKRLNVTHVDDIEDDEDFDYATV